MIEPLGSADAIGPPRIGPRRRKALIVALTTLAVAFVLTLGWLVLHPPSVAPQAPPSVVAAAAGALLPPHDWRAVDRKVANLLMTARLQQELILQSRIGVLSGTFRTRVERDFLPWYLSFGRRKLEELDAYNLYARDRLVEWTGGGVQNSAQAKLVATFESEFSRQVLRSDDTRKALRQLGQDLGEGYAGRVAAGLREIQEAEALSFSAWQAYLSQLAPLSYVTSEGQRVSVPVSSLASPDPVWLDLGREMGERVAARFDRMGSIINMSALVDPKGHSIFAAGENAGVYFGSYLVYWTALIILLRSGLIPFNIFGMLLGWLLWESMSWGTWIGFEYLDFEQTRNALAPVIEARAEAYFSQLTPLLADLGPRGPLGVLYQLEDGFGR
ncbi:hypothetical protein MCP1_210071 [Candidatus Terasakiella magnetica]|nr:hypothetical protein MCP1_210071 [Candidatus Terasakiella magnetica]